MTFEEYDDLVCLAHKHKPFSNAVVCVYVSWAPGVSLEFSYRWVDRSGLRHGIALSVTLLEIEFSADKGFIFEEMSFRAKRHMDLYRNDIHRRRLEEAGMA